MFTEERYVMEQHFFKKLLKVRKSKRVITGFFIFALLFTLLSVFVVRPLHVTHAAGTNTAEDNFHRANTTLGWGTTTNNDGLTNYIWQRSLNNGNTAFLNSNNGVIVYAGTNGHKIAGYVKVPVQSSGDVLAEITFTATGHGVAGVTLLVTGGTSWYQADMNTSTKTLEIRKRLNGIMTTVTSIPFTYVANTAYWLRLDVQISNNTAVINENAWAAGTTEPTKWLVTYTDSKPLPAGSAGAMGDWFRSPAQNEQERFGSWSYAAQGLATPAQ